MLLLLMCEYSTALLIPGVLMVRRHMVSESPLLVSTVGGGVGMSALLICYVLGIPTHTMSLDAGVVVFSMLSSMVLMHTTSTHAAYHVPTGVLRVLQDECTVILLCTRRPVVTGCVHREERAILSSAASTLRMYSSGVPITHPSRDEERCMRVRSMDLALRGRTITLSDGRTSINVRTTVLDLRGREYVVQCSV